MSDICRYTVQIKAANYTAADLITSQSSYSDLVCHGPRLVRLKEDSSIVPLTS